MPLTFGSGMSQIAGGISTPASSGGSSGGVLQSLWNLAKQGEDTAFSVVALIAASGAPVAGLIEWVNRREHQQFLSSSGHAFMNPRKRLNDFFMEMFTQRLLPFLGIRTAPARIVDYAEAFERARQKPGGFVVKEFTGRKVTATLEARLNPSPRDYFCLISDVVPDAVSLDFLARRFGIRQGLGNPCALIAHLANDHAESFVRELTEHVLGKECPAADVLYESFTPTADIRNAIRWNGPEYLRICASRAFLGCSAGHNGNILVTRGGELLSIDHCAAHREDGDDLRKLFRLIRRDSAAFNVLENVAKLDETDIRAAVAEVRHRACGSTVGLADYFVSRLRLWRSLYEAAPSRAVAQAV